ncbi:MAG: Ldh family oxidoreductase [Deltaproteobacteria bacterium]|nr:Ldh family oxidoreductase [Deltaproteobacteria bacterium]
MKESKLVSAAKLREFCKAAFLRAGLTEANASASADNLILSNLRGVDSHGVVRLPKYIKRLQAAGMKANPRIQVERKSPSAARVDGDNGFGLVVAKRAMEEAIHLAGPTGVGVVTVFNSDHFGAAAHYAMMALEKEMIGVVLSNVTPVMSVWGGKGAFIGNNPVAVAVPCLKAWPVVYDVALSKVAGGKVRLAAEKGENIPSDWITDSNGVPTQDPTQFEKGGSLLPLGIKGYGLAVIVEVLAGVLAGSRILDEIPFWAQHLSEPAGLGHFMLALNIGTFVEVDYFKQRMDYLVDRIHNAPRAQGVERIYLPGEIEHLTEKQRNENGIPIPEAVYASLMAMAGELGLRAGELDGSLI